MSISQYVGQVPVPAPPVLPVVLCPDDTPPDPVCTAPFAATFYQTMAQAGYEFALAVSSAHTRYNNATSPWWCGTGCHLTAAIVLEAALSTALSAYDASLTAAENQYAQNVLDNCCVEDDGGGDGD